MLAVFWNLIVCQRWPKIHAVNHVPLSMNFWILSMYWKMTHSHSWIHIYLSSSMAGWQDRKCLINGQFYGLTCGKEVVSAFFSGHLLNNNEPLYPWMTVKSWKHPLLMSFVKNHLDLSRISVLILDYLVKANGIIRQFISPLCFI